MKYFTEQGGSHVEVLEKINAKYGARARILTKKNIRTGGFLGLFTKEGIEYTGIILNSVPVVSKENNLQKEKEKFLSQMSGQPKAAVVSPPSSTTLEMVLNEVKGLKDQLGTGLPSREEKEKSEHETIEKVRQLLLDNEFSYQYTTEIISRIKKELTLEDLDDYEMVQNSVINWIIETIKVYPANRKPRVMVLVGPTGVGKTTTIAKLAAVSGLGVMDNPARTVKMITIDTYRIGARKQIEIYGKIMGIQVVCVESFEDLKKEIDTAKDTDLVLIDTIGKSPREFMKLAQMKDVLEACGKEAEVHLAISATTKNSDIKEILHQFEPFRYSAVILTKLDETTRSGNLISILYENSKSISYITDGQVVPQDIEKASPVKLIKMLDGFSYSKKALEQRVWSQ